MVPEKKGIFRLACAKRPLPVQLSRWYLRLGRAAGSWRPALLRHRWQLGGLQWGPGPWGDPQGRGRGQADPGVPSGPTHLLGALSFKWLEQVPRCLLRASLCGFKSLSLGTGVWIFQNKYLKMKCLHLICFTGLQSSAYVHYFLPMGTQIFLCKHSECFFFPVYNFTLPLLWPFNLITEVFKGHPSPLGFTLHSV